MKVRLALFIFLALALALFSSVSELNNFHTESDNGLTILGKIILEAESDSVFHQLLPVINGENYITAGSTNCEVEISSVMQLRDLEFSILTISPAENLVAGDSLQIVLEGDCQEEVELYRPAESFLKMYIALFPELAERENWRDVEPAQPNILYIYPDTDEPSFWQAFDYLLEWKKQKGFKVYQYAANNPSSQSIKDYIQNAYDTWEDPPEYVCLIGDAGGNYNIPTSYFGNGEGDHYYTTLAGEDQISDVHIGRLSFDNILQWQSIVYKTVMYEREPYIDNPDWFSRALLVGDPTSSGMSCVYTNINIRESIEHNYPEYDYLELYDYPFQPAMRLMVDMGVSYFNYRGYGGMSGWYDGTANYLTNGMMLPFAVISTCATGDFAGTEGCRSEAFLQAGSPSNPRGAIGAIGTATITTHTCFNNCFVTGVAYGLFSDKLQTMGASHTRGKTSLFLNYPQNPDQSSTKFSYWNNLMGDPSVAVWQGFPRELSIACENHYASSMNNIGIQVLNEYADPACDLYCCLYNASNDEQHFSYSDQDGFAYFDIADLDSDEYILTVNGNNFYPRQDTIYIDSEYDLSISDLTFYDNGNNGSFEPGETGNLAFELMNNSDYTISPVEITLFSNSEEIIITNGEILIEQLEPDETVLIDGIELEYQCNPDSDLQKIIGITVQSDNYSFSDSYQLPVTFLEFSLIDFSFTDNNNNIPEPGEEIYFDYEITNSGDYVLTNISLEFSTASNIVWITDNIISLENLQPEEIYQSTNSIVLDIAQEFIAGNNETLILSMSNPDGFEQSIELEVCIGETGIDQPTGPDAFGYCLYDENDSEYQELAYDWIEINDCPELPLYDSGDEGASCTVMLPFTFRYYDFDYDCVTVCSNGWVAPGITESASFMNWAIPGEGGISPIIAVFWDDLVNTDNISGIYYYYNPAEHFFIIEWDRLRNDWDNSQETFEIIIYDRDYYPSSNGNNIMKFQYKDFNNTNAGNYEGIHDANHGQYATIGIEDQTGRHGLQYTYNNDYPDTGSQLGDQSALMISGQPVPEDSAWVVIDDYRFINSTGQELVTPGDTISLSLDLWNIGNEPTEVINLIMSCENNSFIEFIDNEILITEILPGSLAENIIGLNFCISENYPPLEELQFNLEIISGGLVWNYGLNVVVSAPLIDFDEDIINFGEVYCNYEATYELIMENDGTAPLEITEVVSSSPNLISDFSPIVIDPGDEQNLLLTLLIDEIGEFSATLTIISNSINSNTFIIPVMGIVVFPPIIEVDSTLHCFDAELDEINCFPIDISNTGDGTLCVSAHLEGFYNSRNGALFSSGYLNLSQPVITGEEFTIEAWARMDGPGFHVWETNTIYEQRDNEPEDYRAIMTFHTRTISGNNSFTLQGANSTGTVLNTPAPPFGDWHHYAVTVNEDFINLYQDGLLKVTEINNESGGYTSGVDNVDIGAHRYSGILKSSFNGMMDEVRFWDRDLTPLEILDHQYHSVDPDSENLTAYWTFNSLFNWQEITDSGIDTTPFPAVDHFQSEAPINDWSSIDTESLVVEGGESNVFNLQVDTAWLDLGGSYQTNLVMQTNDPEAQNIVIPIEVTVVPSSEDQNEIPYSNQLSQNYPNPLFLDSNFRAATIIEYDLLVEVIEAEIIIYNIKGQKVKTYVLDPEITRQGSVSWSGDNNKNRLVGSGVYFYSLKTDGIIRCNKKMLLLR
ncbi:MAG: C25 family cysteine peptidase [Candidatus Stygibacter australis]|nr:C25 family cysteine peptidase [Candidatus Stygibacter australis]